jgi:hypothetical protein
MNNKPQSNSTMLISFCNSGGDLLGLSLGYYDLSLMKFSYLKIQEDVVTQNSFDMGFTGLCTDNFFNIYIAVQSSVPRVLVFDRAGVFIKTINLPSTKDLHDIKLYDNKLWVVSTGNNRLYTLNLNESSTVSEVLAFHQSDCDVMHFNSILHCSDGGCLYSFTANELGEHTDSVRNSRNEVVVSDLNIPHSLFEHSYFFIILNSLSSEVVIFDKNNYHIIKSFKLRGFLRGICVLGDKLYIGRSSLRLDSRKNPSGEFIDLDFEDCRCGFYEISITDFSIVRFTDLTVYGNEIYEITASPEIESVNLHHDSLICSIVRKRKRVLQLENWLSMAMLEIENRNSSK